MTYTLEFVQGAEKADGIINDKSIWGASGNPARNLRGNVLLLSKNDKAGVRTYITIVNTDPLNRIQWTFVSTLDGWHQATLLVFRLWDSATAYLANVNAVYHTASGKYWKAKTSHTGISPLDPTGPDNWQEITDFTLIQQGYTNVDVANYDFAVESRLAISLTDKLYNKIGETFLCKFEPEEAVNLLNLLATREGYRSKFIDSEPDQGEEIIRAMEACLE